MTKTSETSSLSVSLLLGLILYVTGFFLPAVDSGSGFECAKVAFFLLWNWPPNWLFFIGLLNPVILIYLLAHFLGWNSVIRFILVLLTFVGIGVTWLVLFGSTESQSGNNVFTVHVGHVIWVSGMLLIIAPELASWRVFLTRGSSAADTSAVLLLLMRCGTKTG